MQTLTNLNVSIPSGDGDPFDEIPFINALLRIDSLLGSGLQAVVDSMAATTFAIGFANAAPWATPVRVTVPRAGTWAALFGARRLAQVLGSSQFCSIVPKFGAAALVATDALDDYLSASAGACGLSRGVALNAGDVVELYQFVTAAGFTSGAGANLGVWLRLIPLSFT